MRKVAIILLCHIFLISCKSENKKSDNGFEDTVFQVLNAFQEKDAAKVNQFIHKDTGAFVLFRKGAFDTFETINTIDFSQPVVPDFSPEYPSFSLTPGLALKYETLPHYDCGEMKWDKIGLFCDTKTIDDRLSVTLKNLKEYFDAGIPDSEIAGFEKMEKDSRRIVLSSEKDDEYCIFYLTLIDNKWYLTIIDLVTTDCGA